MKLAPSGLYRVFTENPEGGDELVDDGLTRAQAQAKVRAAVKRGLSVTVTERARR